MELREELTRLGHHFRSRTDTEVVLYVYEEWGEACGKHFNGMWAYAIWDQRSRQLVLSRDRFGIKPLFIARTRDAFFFASEAKAILASGEIAREPNLSYIKHMLSVDTPLDGTDTPFVGIQQLPAGHNLILTRKAASQEAFWRYSDKSEAYDYTEPTASFKEIFLHAVKIRLRGDVRSAVLLFCCSAVLLSGGVDSSAIALAAADQAPGDMQAFTARFSGFRNDESRYAALAAQRAGIPVTMVDYDARDLINDLARVTWHMDAPVAKGQMLARWALIRSAAAGGAKIILEGQGADELLGGYPDRYARAYLGSELDQPQIGALAMMLPWAGIAAAAYARRLLLRSLGVVPVTAEQNHPSRLLSRRLQAAPPYGIPPAPAISARFTDRLAERLWQDHAHLLLPYLLHFGDAISMGNAMESRLPFLDHRLVEFAFALPFRWKIRNGEFKVVLRRALAAELSPETLARKLKVGFATPVGEWLTRAWTSDVIPLLSSLRLRQRDIFDNKALARLSTGFEAHGHAPLMVFRCAAIELWFQQFIDGDGFHASGR